MPSIRDLSERVSCTKHVVVPLLVQKAIVKTVNSLMVLCDNLEQELKLSEKQLKDWIKGAVGEVVK